VAEQDAARPRARIGGEGRARKRKKRVRERLSVNKVVDVLIPRHDRVPASAAFLFLSLSLSLFLGSLSHTRDEASEVRKRGTVIIKSCNQLANLSSSVLIKPGPPCSAPPLSLSLSLSLSKSLLFLPFHTSRLRRRRFLSQAPHYFRRFSLTAGSELFNGTLRGLHIAKCWRVMRYARCEASLMGGRDPRNSLEPRIAADWFRTAARNV